MDKQKLIEDCKAEITNMEEMQSEVFPMYSEEVFQSKMNRQKIALASLEAEPVGCVEDVMPGRGANAYRFRKTKGAVLHAYMPLYAAPPAPVCRPVLMPEIETWRKVREVDAQRAYRRQAIEAIRAAGGEVSE